MLLIIPLLPRAITFERGLRSCNKFNIIIVLCSVTTFSAEKIKRQLVPTIVPGGKKYTKQLRCRRCCCCLYFPLQTMKIFSETFEIMRVRQSDKKCLKLLWVDSPRVLRSSALRAQKGELGFSPPTRSQIL